MSEFENDVREMLRRRAADVSGSDVNPSLQLPGRPEVSRRGDPARPKRLAVAIAALLVVGGAATWFTVSERPDPELVELAVEYTSTTQQSPTQKPLDTQPPDPTPSAPTWTLAKVEALLPDAVDLDNGPLVFVSNQEAGDAVSIGNEYLASHGASSSAVVDQIDEQGELTLLSWSSDNSSTGFLVVRQAQFDTGVVAAISGTISFADLERNTGGVSGTIGAQGVAFDAALTDDAGTVLWSMPPGTTGEVAVDVDLPPFPAWLLVRQGAGSTLVVDELAIGVTGFETECGTSPPVALDLGDTLGRPVAVDTVEGNYLPNQRVWRYESEDARIDLVWPADPVQASRLRLVLDPGDPRNGAISLPSLVDLPDFGELSLYRTPLSLGSAFDDPCNFFQLNVYAEEAVADAWSGAFGAQWSLGFPFTLPDLELQDGPFPDDVVDLILESYQVEDTPVVAATGSCDGLPNDPPRTGEGPQESYSTPEEALEAFLSNQPALDPPLPSLGYYEFITSDTSRSYVIGQDRPIIVIDATLNEQGWQIEQWMAAPC